MSRPVLRVVDQAEADERWNMTTPHTLDEFFERECGVLFRRMWLVTRDRQEAEEVMQDAFLIVFERWDRVGAMDDPTGYLYRTAFNTWKRRARRAARAIRLVIEHEPTADDPRRG